MAEVMEPPAGKGYDLQAVYAEKLEPFWFRWADRWWQLPHLRMLDFGIQADVESFDFGSLTESADNDAAKAKVEELFVLIMGADQAKDWAEVKTRPIGMLLDMIQAWAEHSGAKQGEAPASPVSSTSTGRPSKRTSSGSTASASRKPSRPRKAAAGTPPASS